MSSSLKYSQYSRSTVAVIITDSYSWCSDGGAAASIPVVFAVGMSSFSVSGVFANVRHTTKVETPTGAGHDGWSSHWIVLTTINYPTESVKKLARLEGWRMVVVADHKTPVDWQLASVDFLSVEKQAQLPYKLAIDGRLPFRSYA